MNPKNKSELKIAIGVVIFLMALLFLQEVDLPNKPDDLKHYPQIDVVHPLDEESSILVGDVFNKPYSEENSQKLNLISGGNYVGGKMTEVKTTYFYPLKEFNEEEDYNRFISMEHNEEENIYKVVDGLTDTTIYEGLIEDFSVKLTGSKTGGIALERDEHDVGKYMILNNYLANEVIFEGDWSEFRTFLLQKFSNTSK